MKINSREGAITSPLETKLLNWFPGSASLGYYSRQSLSMGIPTQSLGTSKVILITECPIYWEIIVNF